MTVLSLIAASAVSAWKSVMAVMFPEAAELVPVRVRASYLPTRRVRR